MLPLLYYPVQLSWISLIMMHSFSQPTGQYLSYLSLGVTSGVTTQYLPQVDDGASGSIPIQRGFRFGTSRMTNVYVGVLLLLVLALETNQITDV